MERGKKGQFLIGHTGWNKGLLGYRKGFKHSEETKKKLSLLHIGKKPYQMTDEIRKNMSDAKKRNPTRYWFGKTRPEETRKKISEGNRGKVRTEAVRLKIGEAQVGGRNYCWKGNNVGYYGLHKWVRRWKGVPQMCEFCGVEGRKNGRNWSIHWANKSGKYIRDLFDWIALCVRCHSQYDHNLITL
ncbi:MAG: NUMOD3 domain-containing DNA-binding protein [Candidatus Berkelbacteria bacterium]|nr:NUMOD3 domain-containing DNA-binding protein [Candidatus Berkelbacteria bacterium]